MPLPDKQPLVSVPWDCDFLPTPEGKLFRAYAARPDSGAPGLLMFNPLGEEAKSAFAVLNDLARTAWNAGWSVGRFDYLGTGDSEGEFAQTVPNDWLRDARHVVRDFQTKFQPDDLVLVGLRLGGNIAATLASDPDALPRASGLILWEPILDFSRYLRHLRWVNRDGDSDGSVDHYGWRLTGRCLEALPSTLALDSRAIRYPTLIAQVRTARRLVPEFEAFSQSLPEGSSTRAVSARPFWEPIGEARCELLVEETMSWLDHVNAGATAR